MPKHRNPLHAEAEGKSLDFLGIVSYLFEDRRVDAPRAQDFQPAFAAADTAAP